MPQDYIVRLIQQMAAMLAVIVSRKQAGRLDEAGEAIAEECLRSVGLPWEMVVQAPPDALQELLAVGGELRFVRSIALAELLLQDAEIQGLRGNPLFSAVRYEAAHRLLTGVVDALAPEEREHYRAKLADVATRLADLGADPADHGRSDRSGQPG